MKSTKADIRLIQKIRPYTSPDSIPFIYSIGEKAYAGIPNVFNPKVTRTRVDSCITDITVTANTPEGLLLRAECREFYDYPVTEWVMYIENTSDTDSPVISSWSFNTDFCGVEPKIYHGNGDNCTESGYEWYIDNVTENPIVIAPCNDGTPCNGAFPYMRLIFEDYCVNITVGWSGTWKLTAQMCGAKTQISASQAVFKSYLKPGECVRSPRMTLQAVAGTEDRARNLWRSFYFAHICPRENGQPLPPKLVLHTWMIDNLPEFCGVTEKNQLLAIDTYMNGGFKPDIWWIDAGWYPCDNNWPHTGNWFAHPGHFPNGLGTVGKKCDENDIELLVWFEPERVHRDSALWCEHPEFLLYYKNNDNPWLSDNALLDLGNPKACDWIIETADKLIKDWHIRIYRQDFNFVPGIYWAQNTEKDRDGILENLHILGYYRYWDTLIERNPGLWMDSCASGGRRNDPETMRRAVALHYTDVGYGNHPVKQKQHREMFEWLPYFRAHNMNWDEPDGSYGGTSHKIDEFGYQNALAPSLTSMVEWNDSDELFEIGRKFHPIWRKAAELELSCDYYPLTECKKDPSDWYAMQFDGDDKGFIQIIRNTKVTEDTVTLNPHTEPDKTYVFTEAFTGRTVTLSGKDLAESGFTDTLPKRSGVIWFYTKTNV